jgi:hypothetical protein
MTVGPMTVGRMTVARASLTFMARRATPDDECRVVHGNRRIGLQFSRSS